MVLAVASRLCKRCLMKPQSLLTVKPQSLLTVTLKQGKAECLIPVLPEQSLNAASPLGLHGETHSIPCAVFQEVELPQEALQFRCGKNLQVLPTVSSPPAVHGPLTH